VAADSEEVSQVMSAKRETERSTGEEIVPK
jgi:hypothetical protein